MTVVAITGAGSGIGRALAIGFAGDGDTVLGFERSEEGLRETAALAGPNFVPVAGSVTSAADVEALLRRADADHGGIEVLINNAGIANQGAFLEAAFERWEAVIAVNLAGLARCCHVVLPGMIARGKGRIINVASRAAEAATPTLSAYAASKAGVVTFTRTLAREVGPPANPGILVNCLVPGQTNTGMHPGGQDPAVVYPHARFIAELPDGGPNGRIFWNSKDYSIYTRFNES